MTEVTVIEDKPKRGLITRFAERYGIDANKVLETLKATAFKSERPVSNEQMMALMIVAERYGLDPFTKELYAYPDKGGGIVPVVSVDGWARMVNEQPMFDGLSFDFDREQGAMSCTIWRKDRTHPTEVEELIDECYRDNSPAWKKSPRRMIRHRAFMQCARLAFGFTGLHDDDEAQRIVEAPADRQEPPSSGVQKVRARLSPAPADLGTPAQPIEAEDAIEVIPDDWGTFYARVARAPDAESAALILDEARSVPTITDGQHEALAQLWADKWQPNED